MLFTALSWWSPCAPGAKGPLTLKGMARGWTRCTKKLVLKIKRFKSLPFLENTIPGWGENSLSNTLVKLGFRQATSSVTLKGNYLIS